MGIVLTDYVIESVIRDGLRDLRDRPELLDDLMSQLLEDYLKTDYGQQKLNELKDYIKNNKIYVIQSFGLQGGKFPCYSINLDNLNESDREAGMQDFDSTEEVEITPTVLAGPFTATFDDVSSAILVGDSVDLSEVRVRSYLTDAAGTNFQVVGGIINENGRKQFVIDTSLNGDPDVSGEVQVVSQIGSQLVEYQSVPIREKVLIGVYAQNDPNITKYLYYLLMYFLHQRKSSLEDRGVELSSIVASDFMREEPTPGLPEHIFARYVHLNCLTRFKWEGDSTDIFGSAGLSVRVPKDQVIIDEPDRTVNTETE